MSALETSLARWVDLLTKAVPALGQIPHKEVVLPVVVASILLGLAISLWIALSALRTPPALQDRKKRAEALVKKGLYAQAQEVYLSVHAFKEASRMAIKLGQIDEAVDLAQQARDHV